MIGEHARHSGDTPTGARIREVHEAADAVLRQLRADRAASEQRLSDQGRADPMKMVTGASSMDRAIRETEGILDRIVGEYADEIAGAAGMDAGAVEVDPVTVHTTVSNRRSVHT